MTISELRAAATRLADAIAENRTPRIEDANAVATAWLADHPADDGETVTADFMFGVGANDSSRYRYEKRFEILDGAIQVRFDACAGPKCWDVSLWIGTRKALYDPTRGDVRRLLAALKIEPPA